MGKGIVCIVNPFTLYQDLYIWDGEEELDQIRNVNHYLGCSIIDELAETIIRKAKEQLVEKVYLYGIAGFLDPIITKLEENHLTIERNILEDVD